MFSSWVLAVAALSAGMGQTAASDPFSSIRELLKESEYRKAASQLDAMDRAGLTPLGQFTLGWFYGQAHRFDTALKIFRSIPANIPEPPTHAYAVALCQFQLSDYGAVISSLQPFAGADGSNAKLLNLLGVAYLKTGSADKAFAIFQDTIKRYPADPVAYFNSVTELCENGRLTECMEAAGETARIFPQLPEAHITYGASQLENGRLREGREEFAAARKLAPQSPEAAFFQALCDYKAANYERAVDVLRGALHDGAADADVHTLLAEALLRRSPDEAAAALGELNNAIALSPHSVAALTARGKLYLKQKKYVQAAADLERAVVQDATSRAALYTLARVYQAQGDSARAQQVRSRLAEGSDDPVTNLGQGRLQSALHGFETR